MWTDKGAKVEGVNYTAYGVVYSTDFDGNNCHLAIRVYGRRGANGFIANYYAGAGRWPFKEVQRATEQALEQYERRPSIDEIIAKRRAATQARVDAFLSKLRAMSDEELVAYMEDKAEEEREYLVDVEKGKWDWDDQRDISRDYNDFFWYAEEVLTERGLPEVKRATREDHLAPRP